MIARFWVAVVELFSVDGLRVRVDVVVFLAVEEVEAVVEAGRVGLAAALVVRDAVEAVGFVRSRAGTEGRAGLVTGFVAVFKDVRLGLCATLGASRVAVFVAVGRTARVVRVVLSSVLAGEVGVRGCAGDLEAGLGAVFPTWIVEGRFVTVLVGVGLGVETLLVFTGEAGAGVAAGAAVGAGASSMTSSEGFSGSTGAGSTFSDTSFCDVSEAATGCSVIF